MVDYTNSPLKNPDFFKQSASSKLADSLTEPSNVAAAVVADREGNARAGSEMDQAILGGMSYGELVYNYGKEVADRVGSARVSEELGRQNRILNAEQSNAQIVGDTAIGFGAGFVNTVGSIIGAGIGGIGAVDKYFDE